MLMPKEHAGRIHGDGRLMMDSFDRPNTESEKVLYQGILKDILRKAGVKLKIDKKDPDLSETLLTLRQRFEIGFSNGCPWPNKLITKFLSTTEKPPQTLKELTELIRLSSLEDGKHSALFQVLLANASDSLRGELTSFHSWNQITGQENQNLPADITRRGGKGAYGLAYDPPYFQVIKPLRTFIDGEESDTNEARQERTWKVIKFFERTTGKTSTIDRFVAKTDRFLQKMHSTTLNP